VKIDIFAVTAQLCCGACEIFLGDIPQGAACSMTECTGKIAVVCDLKIGFFQHCFFLIDLPPQVTYGGIISSLAGERYITIITSHPIFFNSLTK